MAEASATAIARIAGSGRSLPTRAGLALVALQRAVGYDAAWLADDDRLRGRLHQLASVNVDTSTCDFLSRSTVPRAVAPLDADEDRWSAGSPPRCLSEAERATWSASMARGGVHHLLAVALMSAERRQVGSLVLFFRDPAPPSPSARRRLADLEPALALAIDPLPTLLTTARLVRGVVAGRLLCRDGSTEALPGLADDPLLATGSPVLSGALDAFDDGLLSASFLWPLGGAHAPDGHVRITLLAAPEDVAPVIAGMALTSPPPDLHELTPRELEVLGLVVEGCSNQEIARLLVVSPRTVAAHVEHLLAKLDATTRTLAAVRAQREGLYVPAAHSPPRQVHRG